MFTKLSFRNASIFALIVLFATISLFPMGLSADMDNLYFHDVAAVTMAGGSYYHPYVYVGGYANIDNYSGKIPVRYYFHGEGSVWGGGKNPIFKEPDSDKGWVQPGEYKSFFPYFTFDMTRRKGRFTAIGKAELGLKLDFNGDGVFDDSAMVSSSDEFVFEIGW